MSARKWEICVTCNGDGKHSRRLGAFTSSEWEQEDDDFRENYLAGGYDETCGDCEGTGKVLSEPHVCSCCGEECPDGRDCCSDDFPEPCQLREMGETP